MNKLEVLKIKHEIYQTIMTAMLFNDTSLLNNELVKLDAQIELLEGDDKNATISQ